MLKESYDKNTEAFTGDNLLFDPAGKLKFKSIDSETNQRIIEKAKKFKFHSEDDLKTLGLKELELKNLYLICNLPINQNNQEISG